MIERVKFMLAALCAVALLLLTVGAASSPEQAGAAICTKNCPPPLEEPEESPVPDPEPIPAPGKYSVLVVNVGWGDGSNPKDSLIAPEDLSRYVNHLRGNVSEWFAHAAPPGLFPGFTVDSGGTHKISRPDLPSNPEDCSNDEAEDFLDSLIDLGQGQLDRKGIDYGKYSLVLFHYNGYFCFTGVQVGKRILLADHHFFIHEFGHLIGLDHANALHCKDGSAMVPLSNDCKEFEYGDFFDAMGGGPSYLYNAIHSKQLGWLEGQYFDMKAPETGTLTLRPFTKVGAAGRALRLKDGPTTLWVEYRLPHDLEDLSFNFVAGWPSRLGASGVVIHREVIRDGETFSQLLDMTPEEKDARAILNPALPVGTTWENPLGDVTIKVTRVDEFGAQIVIGRQRTNKVPNIVGLTPARAGEVLAQAGLVSGGWEGKPDPSCASLGLVMGQFPYAGEMVRPGTPVKFTVGEKDAQQGCL